MTLKSERKIKNTDVVKTEPFDMQKPIKNLGKIKLPTYEETPKVKGIFRNLEFPGTGITFPFRNGWKGPIKNFTLFDGLEYEIPETLAKHLNERCCYKTLKWVSTDGTETVNARPIACAGMPNYKQEIDKKTHRFMFQITVK